MRKLILLSITIVSSLAFSACTKYVSTKGPKLHYTDCNITLSGKFKTNNKYVLIEKKKFKEMIKKCNKIKKQCEFMREEIKEYNNKFTKGS